MHVSRTAVLGLGTLVLLLTSVSTTAFSLFMPSMELEFGWSRAVSTIPFTVAMAAWGISAPLFGKMADDYGTRPVILSGIVMMAAGFLGVGLAQDLLQFTLAFGLMVGPAMGACGLSIVTLLISKHFDARGRGLAVSVVQTATPLNPLVFAPLLFLLMVAFDWRRAALAVSVLLAAVALPLAWAGARDPDSARIAARQRLGWSATLPYLRHRSVVFLFLARFACGIAFFQHAHLVGLALSKGFAPPVGATAVSVFGASAVIWTLLFGWLADRYGRARMLGVSYLMRGAGTVALAFTTPNELLFYVLVAVAIGPTFGTVTINNVMFFEAVGPRLAGVVLGLSFIVHQVGSSAGPLLGGIVYDVAHTYDGFQLGLGLALLAAGALVYNIRDVGEYQPERVAAGPSPA